MKSLLYMLAALAVIGSGFWAYRENYATQAELERVSQLRLDIASARERLAKLNAEWAFLNRPDRLRDLADLNFDRLGLLPLQPEQFGLIDQVIMPRPARLDLSRPIDISTGGAGQ